MDTLRNNRNCESSIENSSSIFTGNEIKGDGTSPDRNGLWINRSKRVVFREEKNYNNNNWSTTKMREKSETETKVTICSRQSHVRSYCEGFFTCLFLVLVAAVLYFFFVVYDTTQAADVDDYKCAIYNNCTEVTTLTSNITVGAESLAGSRRKKTSRCDIQAFEKEIAKNVWMIEKQNKAAEYYDSIGVSSFMSSFAANIQVSLEFRKWLLIMCYI